MPTALTTTSQPASSTCQSPRAPRCSKCASRSSQPRNRGARRRSARAGRRVPMHTSWPRAASAAATCRPMNPGPADACRGDRRALAGGALQRQQQPARARELEPGARGAPGWRPARSLRNGAGPLGAAAHHRARAQGARVRSHPGGAARLRYRYAVLAPGPRSAEARARDARADGIAFGLDRRDARSRYGDACPSDEGRLENPGAPRTRGEGALMNRPPRYPLTVFYDASCPMCASEMHALRDLDREGRLELVDCSAAQFSDEGLRAEGITKDKLMALIHARDAHGRWLVGIDCFEAVYRAVGLEGAARIWGDRQLRPLLKRAYPWIARNRQTLSRLGVNRLVRWLLPKVARHAQHCDGYCP